MKKIKQNRILLFVSIVTACMNYVYIVVRNYEISEEGFAIGTHSDIHMTIQIILLIIQITIFIKIITNIIKNKKEGGET